MGEWKTKTIAKMCSLLVFGASFSAVKKKLQHDSDKQSFANDTLAKAEASCSYESRFASLRAS